MNSSWEHAGSSNKMPKAKSLMVLGTGSGVGKSLIAAGLCRILSDWGYKVAPFKAQNMSNNSYVTDEGGEMGRAQVVQAECARVKPHTDMNPVLLKPAADNFSQAVVQGKAIGHYNARDYFSLKEKLIPAVKESYARLAAQYDVIVLEGAGSPAEVNLKDRDFVNMAMAEAADARCVLVADIDRGGVFASLIGTLDLLTESERGRIHGLIINKFRGDRSLFDDGVAFLESRTGKKVWGVLPFDRELRIDEEDAVTVETENDSLSKYSQLEVGVVLLPHMSNFTDFEVLKHEPNIRLRYLRDVSEFGNPDLLILPGTKSTMADLFYLEKSGMRNKIMEFVLSGGALLGICGGFQMMGKKIIDTEKVESFLNSCDGLGFFNLMTEFSQEKVLKKHQVQLHFNAFGQNIISAADIYEIHMGDTHLENQAEGVVVHSSGRILGTYYHGLFDHAGFRNAFFKALASFRGKEWQASGSHSASDLKEVQYCRLADLISGHLDLGELKKTLGVPSHEKIIL